MRSNAYDAQHMSTCNIIHGCATHPFENTISGLLPPEAIQPPLMLPKMPIPSKMLVKQEGRILLAIEAIQKDQTSSIREAARFHDVPQTTLHARLAG